MLKRFVTLVPCAYRTMGLAPVHCGLVPVGTINAPDAVVISFAPPTVPYWRYFTSTPQTGGPASCSRLCPEAVACREAVKSAAVSDVVPGGGVCINSPRPGLLFWVPRAPLLPPPHDASSAAAPMA